MEGLTQAEKEAVLEELLAMDREGTLPPSLRRLLELLLRDPDVGAVSERREDPR